VAIRVSKNEIFPIVVSLMDYETETLVTGETVYYDVRDSLDNELSPTVSGVLTESSVEPGVYKEDISLSDSGSYTCYLTCSDFLSGTEEIIVNPEDIYELIKQNRHYNTSVEDVPRTLPYPNNSQFIRNVPLNKTDYIITRVKKDDELDWSLTTASGIVYAWYRSNTDDFPYLMGASDGTVVSGAGEDGEELLYVTNFLELTDTPTTYSGYEGQYLVSTSSGIEYTTVFSGTSVYSDDVYVNLPSNSGTGLHISNDWHNTIFDIINGGLEVQSTAFGSHMTVVGEARKAQGTISLTGLQDHGDTFTCGGSTFTTVSGYPNSSLKEIYIAPTVSGMVYNIAEAINDHEGGFVTATTPNDSSILVEKNGAGISGNLYAFYEDAANLTMDDTGALYGTQFGNDPGNVELYNNDNVALSTVNLGTGTGAGIVIPSRLLIDPGSPTAPGLAFIHKSYVGISSSVFGCFTFVWAGNPIFSFTDQGIHVFKNGTPSQPSIAFNREDNTDGDTGFYSIKSNTLGATTSGTLRLTIEESGVLSVSGTNNYENLVIDDDDIPNKKYIDDNVPIITDWQPYVLNIEADDVPLKGTVLIDNSQWRRIGSSMEIVYSYSQSTGGDAGLGDYLFQIPGGYNIDLSIVEVNGIVGSASAESGGIYTLGSVIVGDSTSLKIASLYGFTGVQIVGSTQHSLGNNNVKYSFETSIPISGWQ
jgi:hypothetical protein